MSKTTNLGSEAVSRPEITDLFVGMRVSMRRKILGMEQPDLAMAAGISVKELQALEAGSERISAALLYQFSQHLTVPVSWFFDGLGPEAEAMFGGLGVTPEAVTEALQDKDGIELLRFYYDHITDPHLKRVLVEVARTLAEPGAQAGSQSQ